MFEFMITNMINFMVGVYTTLNTGGTTGVRVPAAATTVTLRMVDGGASYMFVYLSWSYMGTEWYEGIEWDKFYSHTHKILIEKPQPMVLPLAQATILAHMGVEDLDY